MNKNGVNSNGLKPGVVHHSLMSGVDVRIIPLSPYLRQKLVEYTHKEYPFDDTPWRKPLENSLAENQTYLDETDPEYKRALLEVLNKRNIMLTRLMVQEAVSFEQSQDELIKLFSDRIERLRKYNEEDESDWDIVFWQILIATDDDLELIMRVARWKEPLTEVEVTDAIRIFQPSLSGT